MTVRTDFNDLNQKLDAIERPQCDAEIDRLMRIDHERHQELVARGDTVTTGVFPEVAAEIAKIRAKRRVEFEAQCASVDPALQDEHAALTEAVARPYKALVAANAALQDFESNYGRLAARRRMSAPSRFAVTTISEAGYRVWQAHVAQDLNPRPTARPVRSALRDLRELILG